MPVVNDKTFVSTRPNVFFGGDAALGPKNVITAVAQGHDAAISIDLYCKGEDINKRPDPRVKIWQTKMGIHEWAFDNDVTQDLRYVVPQADKAVTLKDRKKRSQIGLRPIGRILKRLNDASTAMCKPYSPIASV